MPLIEDFNKQGIQTALAVVKIFDFKSSLFSFLRIGYYRKELVFVRKVKSYHARAMPLIKRSALAWFTEGKQSRATPKVLRSKTKVVLCTTLHE